MTVSTNHEPVFKLKKIVQSERLWYVAQEWQAVQAVSCLLNRTLLTITQKKYNDSRLPFLNRNFGKLKKRLLFF